MVIPARGTKAERIAGTDSSKDAALGSARSPSPLPARAKAGFRPRAREPVRAGPTRCHQSMRRDR
jgi:hypothetical protein